jgi:hypothetical protein
VSFVVMVSSPEMINETGCYVLSIAMNGDVKLLV